VFEFKGNIELAEQFGAPLIINSKYRDGTLRKEAAKRNKPILVYEGGESMRFDYLAINEGLNGCLRLMKANRMIDIEVPAENTVKINRDGWIRANSSGLFHLYKNNGSHVEKGDLLGVVCNPFGNIDDTIFSPANGYIFGVNNQPVVNQGDALIHMGYVD
jgi:predicted deacylase